MPFEPISPVGGFTATPELPRPGEPEMVAEPTSSDMWGAAFRTENTIGSLLSSQETAIGSQTSDPNFDPWGELAGTPYEPYYENFAASLTGEVPGTRDVVRALHAAGVPQCGLTNRDKYGLL